MAESESANAWSFSQDSKFSCRTHTLIKKYSFTWSIDNLQYCNQQNGQYLECSVFPDSTDPAVAKWCLQLYPRGNDEKSNNYISLFMNLVSPGNKKSEVFATFTFSLLNAEGEQLKINKTNYNFKKGSDWGFPKYIKREELFDNVNRLLPNGTLTVNCSIFQAEGHVCTLRRESEVNQFNGQLVKDYRSLLTTGKFTDVVFDVQGTFIKAHKIILVAHSPVLAAMFENDMIEARESRVLIPDIKPEVFTEMVHYIYTGECPNINEMADQLLAAADKYSLEKLKLMCESVLSNGLTVENIADVVVLAGLHTANHLKARVCEFLPYHAVEIIKTESWKKMSVEHPKYFVDAFNAFLSSVSPFTEVTGRTSTRTENTGT